MCLWFNSAALVVLIYKKLYESVLVLVCLRVSRKSITICSTSLCLFHSVSQSFDHYGNHTGPPFMQSIDGVRARICTAQRLKKWDDMMHRACVYIYIDIDIDIYIYIHIDMYICTVYTYNNVHIYIYINNQKHSRYLSIYSITLSHRTQPTCHATHTCP